jgi:hypothetical protein
VPHGSSLSWGDGAAPLPEDNTVDSVNHVVPVEGRAAPLASESGPTAPSGSEGRDRAKCGLGIAEVACASGNSLGGAVSRDVGLGME